MRHYEVVAVVHPDQQGRIGAMIESYKKIVADGGGVVHRLEDWGRRPLAYPIKNQHKAQYLLLNIECEDPTLARLREAFRFSDFVLRSLIVRRDRAIIDPSPIAVERTQKAAARAAALAESREKSSSHPLRQSRQTRRFLREFRIAQRSQSQRRKRRQRFRQGGIRRQIGVGFQSPGGIQSRRRQKIGVGE